MDLPQNILDEFRRHGRRGGRARADRLPPSRRSAIARHAAIRRWVRERFGAARFEDLRMPGGEFVDQGLEDLAHDRVTADALLVALAAPRLRREGVPVPDLEIADPDHRLYWLLVETEGQDLAHARYLARLRQIESFANALCLLRLQLEKTRAP